MATLPKPYPNRVGVCAPPEQCPATPRLVLVRPARAPVPSVVPHRRHKLPLQLSALAVDAGSYDECDENFGDFCSLGPDGRPQKLCVGEKERMLLQCSAAHTRGSTPILTDAEYDNLKEELLWQGSTLSLFSPEELLFIGAERGASGALLSDEEYDKLKSELKQEGSAVAVRGPRCSLRSRKAFSDAAPDSSLGYFATGFAFAVAASALTSASAKFGVTDAIGETLSLALALPLGYLVADVMTQVFLKDRTLLKAGCPSCGRSVYTLVDNSAAEAAHHTATCGSCSSRLEFQTDTQEAVLLGKNQ